ncbi:hypothetical protein HPP92_011394 [Vanilla planifolia]|uniref:Uncharacterized protein n=1 Tax=Vanilla planifolia TaxID=51239 RepID=A0A835V4D7_VANPL|nr:hypothetical protein HPP92_011702 [Vanilla planifolia]KAG0483310.1 hypothetical protein HPP92_011394 [Vanilla planifolia]
MACKGDQQGLQKLNLLGLYHSLLQKLAHPIWWLNRLRSQTRCSVLRSHVLLSLPIRNVGCNSAIELLLENLPCLILVMIDHHNPEVHIHILHAILEVKVVNDVDQRRVQCLGLTMDLCRSAGAILQVYPIMTPSGGDFFLPDGPKLWQAVRISATHGVLEKFRTSCSLTSGDGSIGTRRRRGIPPTRRTVGHAGHSGRSQPPGS